MDSRWSFRVINLNTMNKQTIMDKRIDDAEIRGQSLAFTLVETLVVIAVVILLAALLVSVSDRVQASSRNVKCLSNLRATGAAALAFFADRNGEFFPDKFWYSRPSWGPIPGMRDYLGISSEESTDSPVYRVDTILTCPQLKVMHPLKYPDFLNRSYTMNYFLQMNNPVTGIRLTGGAIRMANVSKPSAMWMFADGVSVDDLGATYGTSVRPSNIVNIFVPHNHRRNVVFMDGHVESLTLEQWHNPASEREFWGNANAPN